MIYHEYVGINPIWIILYQTGELRGFESLGPDPYSTEGRRKVDYLPLLLACRQTYSELITKIYTLPIFTFIDPFSFFAFSATIIPSRFQNIQRVHIDLLSRPPSDFISTERHFSINEMLPVSYKVVRRTRHRIHNALPRGPARRERKKMLWHKMLEIVDTMSGLRSLQVAVGPGRFGCFHLCMMPSDEQAGDWMRLQELLVLGTNKKARIKLNGASRDEERYLVWFEVPENQWEVDPERIEEYNWQDQWHRKIKEYDVNAWSMTLEFNGT
ncbi:hypothetical protein P280DRAFT_476902 [Massarina eburnea CBS 473.64]|uniref:DUF7730 domain-containing protein n=1 Tax=Massarina eburnea CBS 473.64 TaxID=1395130 RepID=A0A6A6SAV9_9PLEO|nr:hypothetical protein P280DRAFT_476902 [Massarina eburnea CBS 473.64]